MYQAVGIARLWREAHADMVDPAGAAHVNLARAADHRDQEQSDSGPNSLQSLTGGDETDSPTDKNRRANIDRPADLEIDIREIEESIVASAERRVGSR